MAFGWIGFTTAFASVVDKPYARPLRLPDASERILPGANSQILGVRSQDLHVEAMVERPGYLSWSAARLSVWWIGHCKMNEHIREYQGASGSRRGRA
jgi:hypothetical protein